MTIKSISLSKFLNMQISRPTSPSDERTSPAVGNAQLGYLTYSSGQSQSPMPQTAQSQPFDRPYKPKFHKAALYHHSSNGTGAEPSSSASAAKEIRTLVIETSAANAYNANLSIGSVATMSTATSMTSTTTTTPSSNLSHQPMVNIFILKIH